MATNVLNLTFDANLGNRAPDAHFSGAQQRQRDFASCLNEFVILTPGGGSAVQLAPNLTVYATPKRHKARYVLDAYRLGQKLCQKHNINCITVANTQAVGLVGYLLKRRLGIPLNVNLLADIVDNPHYLSERGRNHIYNLITKWLLHRADTIRVSTRWEKQKMTGVLKLGDVWHVPFYIDSARFLQPPSAELRGALLGESFDSLILFLGRLSTQKGLFTLVEAARIVCGRFPRARFILAGKGPLRAALQQKIDTVGLRDSVVLHGAVPYAAVPALMHAADIFTITSRYEGTCMVLQEAAVTAKPIVATQFAGAIDLIEHGKSGFLAPIGDAASVADHICDLLAHPDRAGAMGKAVKSRALTLFPKEMIAQRYCDMWDATAQIGSGVVNSQNGA